MTGLTLPVFEMPPVPRKKIPVAVWMAWHTEFVRRLKVAGEYDKIQQSPAHQPAAVPFEFKH